MDGQQVNRPRVIDVHHHYFPPNLNKGKHNELAGWRTPPGSIPWRPEYSIAAMDTTGIDFAILSYPAILGTVSPGKEERENARQCNVAMKSVCLQYPNKFGFFATLPTFDIEGALEEIAYALDVLHADGIALASSYGVGSHAKYIGDQLFESIWEELHRRSAIVFVHGTQRPPSVPMPSPLLGIPITEVPNETFKAAAHLVVTGFKRRYSGVKIILSHLGGSSIILAPRVAALSEYMGCELTADQILEDFKSFYFDTALAAYETNLLVAEAFASSDRLLFGSDLPAVDPETAGWYTDNLRKHFADDKLNRIMHENAFQLFPRLNVAKLDDGLSKQ